MVGTHNDSQRAAQGLESRITHDIVAVDKDGSVLFEATFACSEDEAKHAAQERNDLLPDQSVYHYEIRER